MKYLTKDQQKVLSVVLLLFLTGLAVKTWRTAHPPKHASGGAMVGIETNGASGR